MSYPGALNKKDVRKNERKFVYFFVISLVVLLSVLGFTCFYLKWPLTDLLTLSGWYIPLISAAHRGFFDIRKNSNPNLLPNQNNLFSPNISKLEAFLDFIGVGSLVLLFILYIRENL